MGGTGSKAVLQAPLLWQAALFELGIGTLIVVAPPLFSVGSYDPIRPFLPIFAVLLFVGGSAALLAIGGFIKGRGRPLVPLVAALPVAGLALNFVINGLPTGQIAYGSEVVALCWLAWVLWRGDSMKNRIYFVMVAAILALQGASMLLQPGYYQNPLVYAELGTHLWLVGPLFVFTGVGLVVAGRGTHRRLTLAFAALAAIDLAVLVATFTTTHVWTGVMLYGLLAIVLLLAAPRVSVAFESPILFASFAAVAAAGDLLNGLVIVVDGEPLVPGWAIMRPPVALGLLFIACGLAVALRYDGVRFRRVTATLGTLALVVGLLTIFARITAGEAPDHVAGLLGHRIDDDMNASPLAGPALVVGAALLLLLYVARPRSRLATQAFVTFGSLAIGVVALNLLAYMLNSSFLLDIYDQYAIRQHATVAFGALALAIVSVGITRLLAAPVSDRLFGVLGALGILVMMRGFVSDSALWFIYSHIDALAMSTYQEAVEEARNVMLALLAAVTVGTGVVLTRTITLPLEQILGAIARARAGEARARADVEGDDEIAVVARSFNELTSQLADQSDLNVAVRKAQSDLGEAIVILEGGEPREWNDALATITGYSDEELRTMQSVLLLWPSAQREELRALLRARASETYRLETALMRKGDGLAELEMAVIPLPGTESGEQLAVMRDITERKRAERGLERLALTDPLTDLPNRALFADRLERTISAAHRAEDSFALLYLDLDRFKEVNDAFGHDKGDALLREVGARLGAALATTDTLARFGGDEFAVLLPRARDVVEAFSMAEVVRAVLMRPFDLDGHRVFVEASIGVVLYPADGADADSLLRHADIAMYQAKRNGKGLVAYTVEHDPQSQRRLDVLSDLRQAIARDELLLHYQPQIRMLDGGCCGSLEALVRWNHPTRGMVPPSDFIPLAEESGFINELTLWVIREALSQAAMLRTLGREPRMAINLSARNLHYPGLVDAVAHQLATWNLEPSTLTLEITETAVMSDAKRSLQTLNELSALGVRLSVDDFGTGYSSLAYLRRLPVNELKVDRSFVMDMLANPSSDAIVSSTIQLGHSLGLAVVAEGVEDAATLAALKARRCDFAQGYHIARPMPFDQLIEWMRMRGPVIEVTSAAE